MNAEQFLTDHLERNKELRDNLRPESLPTIAATLGQRYRVDNAGDGYTLVDRATNLIVDDVGGAIRQTAYPYLKSRGQGKYLNQYRETRTDNQRTAHAMETKMMFDDYVKKSPVKYVNDEPLRMLRDYVGNNMLFESDGLGGFNFVALMNGVPIERYTPHQVLDRIARYTDHEATEIEDKRLNAKFLKEAMELEQVQPSDMSNPKIKQVVNTMAETLKRRYFNVPTRKKLPAFGPADLESDLQKEEAHRLGLPLLEKAWTHEQRMQLNGVASRRVEEFKQRVWEPLDNILRERPVELYRTYTSSDDAFEGLNYPKKDE